MLSALIPSEHGYSASALGRTTETPEVRLPRSSRTIGSSSSSILTPTSDRDRTVSRMFYTLLPAAQTISSSPFGELTYYGSYKLRTISSLLQESVVTGINRPFLFKNSSTLTALFIFFFE